jgi:hypothetical protein
MFGMGKDLMAQTNASTLVKNIVLVHGAFVDGSAWRGVYDLLKQDGYSVAEAIACDHGVHRVSEAPSSILYPLNGAQPRVPPTGKAETDLPGRGYPKAKQSGSGLKTRVFTGAKKWARAGTGPG